MRPSLDAVSFMRLTEKRFRHGLWSPVDWSEEDETEWARAKPVNRGSLVHISRAPVKKCEWCGVYYCETTEFYHKASCPKKPKAKAKPETFGETFYPWKEPEVVEKPQLAVEVKPKKPKPAKPEFIPWEEPTPKRWTEEKKRSALKTFLIEEGRRQWDRTDNPVPIMQWLWRQLGDSEGYREVVAAIFDV